MNQIIYFAGALMVGLGLGAVYFGGLWHTLRRLPDSRRPGLLVFSSYFGRIALCVAGFFLVGRGGHWERMLIALAGLLAARFFLVRRWGETGASHDRPAPGHADA
ncbi:MAG: N-ATPase subunit AtpR [Thermoleophilia bacterium]